MCFHKQFRILLPVACFLIALFYVLGCDEKPPDTTISQFDRPQDVALVCHNMSGGIREANPLSACRNEDNEGAPGNSTTTHKLYAFVTQTTPGEVAVVDIAASQIVDQDGRIPYNSFIPVGGQPSDIVASSDGKRVYTTNYETGDISVIDVDEVLQKNPTLRPAFTIDLGAPAGRIALPPQLLEDYRDKYAFVTQPTANRIAVVALTDEESNEATADGGLETKANCTNGCLLGYLDLEGIVDSGFCGNDMPQGEDTDSPGDAGPDASLPDHERDPSSSPFSPFAIVESQKDGQIYVGGLGQNCILQLDAQILINDARSLATPGPLGMGSISDHINTRDYTTRTLALDPENESWLYAINKEGGVFVVDLTKKELVEVHGGGYLFDLMGRARAIQLIYLDEGREVTKIDADLSTHWSGTYAVVSTTRGEISIINVDADPITKTYKRPVPGEDGDTDTAEMDTETALDIAEYPKHSLRSRNDLAPHSGNPAHLREAPVLYADSNELSAADADQYAYFYVAPAPGDDESDSDTNGDGDVDGGADSGDTEVDAGACGPDGFLIEADQYGFRFNCDPRVPKAEEWALTWEGPVGIKGAGVLLTPKDFENSASDSEKPTDAFNYIFDETKNFCEQGLREGDLLVITSPPEKNDPCKEAFPETPLIYEIEKVEDYPGTNPPLQGRALQFRKIENLAPLPTRRCFKEAVNYEIRASKQWVLRGSLSGNLYHGIYTDELGQPKCEIGDLESKGRAERVTPGEPFANYYFTFTLMPGDSHPEGATETKKPAETEEDAVLPPQNFVYRFGVEGGFTPLFKQVGNNVTDMALTPNGALVLVDQAENGLVMFDLKNTFSVLGQFVN